MILFPESMNLEGKIQTGVANTQVCLLIFFMAAVACLPWMG